MRRTYSLCAELVHDLKQEMFITLCKLPQEKRHVPFFLGRL